MGIIEDNRITNLLFMTHRVLLLPRLSVPVSLLLTILVRWGLNHHFLRKKDFEKLLSILILSSLERGEFSDASASAIEKDL